MTTENNFTSNIAHCLKEVAHSLGDKTGIIEAKSGKKLSFAQLEKRSDQYARLLEDSGVRPGDRVMLMVKPSADFICLTFALFKLGAPVILIDPGMGYRNLLRCVSGVKPAVFIGIPKAHVFVKIFSKHFTSLRLKMCCGTSFGMFGPDVRKSLGTEAKEYELYIPPKDALAAIIFTTGSTGPPKGVRYEHSIFAAQLQYIRNYYSIGKGDVDQPAFPLFALFSTALGACAVIPDMDVTRPAKVNPQKYIHSILQHRVTYSFGSPALWNVVSNYCIQQGIILDCLKKVLMAGAPVSGELLARVMKILPEDAQIHIPYGATESLPIVSIEAREVVEKTWAKTQQGYGTCVGRPLPGIEVKIIEIADSVIPEITEAMLCKPLEIGEIVVCGDVVTKSYDNNEMETRLAKTSFNSKLWHRLGDTGFIDTVGRLWFCGRKAHRVVTKNGVKFTICCEAIINNHPDIYRSALIGIPSSDTFKKPVIILELKKECGRNHKKILKEVKLLAGQNALTNDIDTFLIHKSFPVDIRHNAKIFREKLAAWAEIQLSGEK